MARRYGIRNRDYDSQIRRCARSGLRFYQKDMVRVAEDTWVHPDWVDRDDGPRAKPRRVDDDWYGENFRKALVMEHPGRMPIGLHLAGGTTANLRVGGD